MENKDLLEMAVRGCQDFMNRGQSVHAVCFTVDKDGEMGIIPLDMEGYKEKERIKLWLKDFLVRGNLKKYMLVFDVKMTIADKKENNAGQVKDAIMINIYEPKERLMKIMPYGEDKKLIDDGKVRIYKNDSKEKVYDQWNIWGDDGSDKEDFYELEKKYADFKNNNKHLYKGLDKDLDKIIEIKEKGEKIIQDMDNDHKLISWFYEDYLFSEMKNEKGKVIEERIKKFKSDGEKRVWFKLFSGLGRLVKGGKD